MTVLTERVRENVLRPPDGGGAKNEAVRSRRGLEKSRSQSSKPTTPKTPRRHLAGANWM
ncbi:hypothetical protein V22_04750 [Calycomorphotria hydatis]|uniref:Uncharacterized protein n=1 Tax=Calycomorphotria hydatis TaxID=2528027 RepID=A0A517T4F0_9PLAN|nr:hypothetical protein V22_04750 [Calycomorphotria hydatis]